MDVRKGIKAGLENLAAPGLDGCFARSSFGFAWWAAGRKLDETDEHERHTVRLTSFHSRDLVAFNMGWAFFITKASMLAEFFFALAMLWWEGLRALKIDISS